MLELWISGDKKESNAWNCSLPMTVKLCQQCEKWPNFIVENFPIPCRAQFFNTRNTFPYFTHHHNSVLEDPNKLRSTCCRPMTRSLGKKVIMVLIERNLYIMTFFAVSHLWIANFSSCWVEACYSLSDPSGILCNCFQFPVRKWELFNHNKIILLIWPSFTCLTSLATCCSNSCLLRWNPR